MIGVLCQKETEVEDPGFDDLYTIGVVAEILRVLEMPDGSTTAILQGRKRFQLHELTETEPYLTGRISLLEDTHPKKSDREFEALISTIKDLMVKMLTAHLIHAAFCNQRLNNDILRCHYAYTSSIRFTTSLVKTKESYFKIS